MGDFNLPSIVWSDGSGQLNPGPTYGTELNGLFSDVINDIGLEQSVAQRRTNIFQGVGAEVTIWQSHSPKSP